MPDKFPSMILCMYMMDLVGNNWNNGCRQSCKDEARVGQGEGVEPQEVRSSGGSHHDTEAPSVDGC